MSFKFYPEFPSDFFSVDKKYNISPLCALYIMMRSRQQVKNNADATVAIDSKSQRLTLRCNGEVQFGGLKMCCQDCKIREVDIPLR